MKISLNVYVRIAIALSSMGVYVFAFLILYPMSGPTVLALAFLPPAIGGWLLGAWGGLSLGVFSFPLTNFLLNLVGDTVSANNLSVAVMGSSSVMLTGMVTGRVRELMNRLKRQTSELEQERTRLEEEVKRRIKAEERLTHEALHDPLTDLPNRRLLVSRLEHALAWNQRNPDKLCALLYLDLNRFKSINDSLGHDAGDQILIQAANRLKFSLRAMDTVARMGGDEFAILLEAASSQEEIIGVVERVQTSLALPYDWNGNLVSSGASIGVVMNLTAYEQIDDIMRDADVAMYRAKSGGGNVFRVFGDEPGTSSAISPS
jgi:diguanylate cyclase (GGDEF)-like protein